MMALWDQCRIPLTKGDDDIMSNTFSLSKFLWIRKIKDIVYENVSTKST